MPKATDELVADFHRAFDLPRPDVISPPDADLARLRARLIGEEFEEVMAELALLTRPQTFVDKYETLLRLAKELADLRYVVEGAAVSFGLDLEAVYREVHRSNMSKLGPGGRPLYREDGKVLKGPNYTEADVKSVLPPILEGSVG